MSLLVDLKYINSITHLLKNFKKTQDYLYNFRCPLCGDSRTNKSKKRAYFLREKDGDGFFFKCHNCGKSLSFPEFLKTLDHTIYKEYVYEKFLEDKGGKREPVKVATKIYKPRKPIILSGFPSVDSLDDTHPAKKYLLLRKIPEKFLSEFFWAENFKDVVDIMQPENQYAFKEHGRIIIPFMDRDKNLMAIQGRSLLEHDEVRYITIKAYEDAPRLYGMHRLEKTWRRIYLVEGPFDSLFLPNCLAMAGADIPNTLPIDKTLVVYDNEPTNKEIRDKISMAIKRGYRVTIWPDSLVEKDINKMIESGILQDNIRAIVDQNSYQGLEALAKLSAWKRPHKKPSI